MSDSEIVPPVPRLGQEIAATIDRYIIKHPLRWIDILRTLDDVQQRLTEKILERSK